MKTCIMLTPSTIVTNSKIFNLPPPPKKNPWNLRGLRHKQVGYIRFQQPSYIFVTCLAHPPSKTWRTEAGKHVDTIPACTAMLTRMASTLIYVCV